MMTAENVRKTGVLKTQPGQKTRQNVFSEPFKMEKEQTKAGILDGERWRRAVREGISAGDIDIPVS